MEMGFSHHDLETTGERNRRLAPVGIELKRFRQGETVEIAAATLSEAHEKLGATMNKDGLVKEAVQELVNEKDYKKKLLAAERSLAHLDELAKTETFTVSGVNYLARYLEAFRGWCKGAKIDERQGALLQMDGAAGCQTISAQNPVTGEIAVAHTEEDIEGYDSKKDAALGKKMINMTIGEGVGQEKVNFYAYPYLCSYGAAFGVKETILPDGMQKSLLQVADVLTFTEQLNKEGKLWSNAIAFMLLDCGEVSASKELGRRIAGLVANEKIIRGYDIHQYGVTPEQKPQQYSVECGYDTFEELQPIEIAGLKVQTGVNLAHLEKLQKIDYTYEAEPKKADETEDEYRNRMGDLKQEQERERWAMLRRVRRMRLLLGAAVKKMYPDEKWEPQRVFDLMQYVYDKSKGDIVHEGVMEGWLREWNNAWASKEPLAATVKAVISEDKIRMEVQQTHHELVESIALYEAVRQAIEQNPDKFSVHTYDGQPGVWVSGGLQLPSTSMFGGSNLNISFYMDPTMDRGMRDATTSVAEHILVTNTDVSTGMHVTTSYDCQYKPVAPEAKPDRKAFGISSTSTNSRVEVSAIPVTTSPMLDVAEANQHLTEALTKGTFQVPDVTPIKSVGEEVMLYSAFLQRRQAARDARGKLPA